MTLFSIPLLNLCLISINPNNNATVHSLSPLIDQSTLQPRSASRPPAALNFNPSSSYIHQNCSSYTSYDLFLLFLLFIQATLINILLLEGRPFTGSDVDVKGKLGTFLLTPFIMNDTVKDNILFGHTSSINKAWYKLVLFAKSRPKIDIA